MATDGLSHPRRMTVVELIAKLQEFSGDLPAVIHDSDTGYLLNIGGVEYSSEQPHDREQPPRVEIYGSYINILGEEDDEDESENG